MKKSYVLKALLLLLAQIVFYASSSEYDDNPNNPDNPDSEHDYGISVSGSGKTLWGKGFSKCDDQMPTFS